MYTIFLPEVAVNTETGKVTVEKFTCVADVGTIMNRLLVEGNFYGGLVQGVGLALTEDFEDLNHDTTLKNCGIPYPKDAPDDIELHFNETYRPSGPYGAAGCGEAPLDAPHPADVYKRQLIYSQMIIRTTWKTEVLSGICSWMKHI